MTDKTNEEAGQKPDELDTAADALRLAGEGLLGDDGDDQDDHLLLGEDAMLGDDHDEALDETFGGDDRTGYGAFGGEAADGIFPLPETRTPAPTPVPPPPPVVRECRFREPYVPAPTFPKGNEVRLPPGIRSVDIDKNLGNGAFVVDLRGTRLTFIGGPYRHSSQHPFAYLVKCATEQTGRFDTEIPCQDFQPFKEADLRRALHVAIDAALAGRPVYAGCMGGIGRTGTFLAAVLKVLMPEYDPVLLLRTVYLPHAVETAAQERLIAGLDVTDLRHKVQTTVRKNALKRLFRLI